MVKKKENTDRLLMIMLNLLLASLVSLIGFGGKQVINNQRETVKAVNDLRIVLTDHNARISGNTNGVGKNSERLDLHENKIDNLDLRVDRLER